MTSENKTSAETNFKILIRMYRIAGIPLLMPEVPKIFYVYSTVMVLLCYGNWLGMFSDILLNYEDFDHISETIRAFVPITLSVVCDAFFRLRRKRLERIMKLTEWFTWYDVPELDPLTGHRTMAVLIPTISSVMLYLMIAAYGFHVIQSVIRLSINKDCILTMNSAYPFNHTVSPNYELVNLSQIVSVFCNALNYYGFGGFYATMVAVSCSQFEKLKVAMVKLREQNLQEYAIESKEEQFRLQNMKHQLAICIHSHQKLIRYIRELEEATSIIIFFIFIMISLGLCFSAFSAAVKQGDVLHHIQELTLSGCNLTLLFCFCWFGNQLTQQAEELRETVWDCGWIGTPIPIQRNIAFLIAMTSAELTLTAGSVATVSLRTSQSILEHSYSFLMFMLNMRQ